MNKYRSHTCNELRKKDVKSKVFLSGWINKKRDHGNLLFIDLRDNYGIKQCVIDSNHDQFNEISNLNNESVITVKGTVILRSEDTINTNISTGEIEVSVFDG